MQRQREGLRRPRRIRMGGFPALRGDLDFGSLVNIIVILIFVGLFGFGIWWAIKSLGQAGEQYTKTMIKTKFSAETVDCQNTLRVIGQNLQMYTITNEGFPATLQELADWCQNPELTHCPVANKQPYIYIPGQRPDMRGENVLVYEREPVHDGKCGVLLLDGRNMLLTPQELEIAVGQTMRQLNR